MWERSYLWEYLLQREGGHQVVEEVQAPEFCSSFFCGAYESPHLYALFSGKGVLSEMFHFSEVLDFLDNICFAEECKWILMTSVRDGRGITGTHVALDQEIREIISV